MIIVVVIASLALMAAAPGYWKLAKLTIWNRTDDNVSLSLKSGDLNYYLTVGSGEKSVFTVERTVFRAQYWSCGATKRGSLDMSTNVKLTFTDCTKVYSATADFGPLTGWSNPGEPTMEKVHPDLGKGTFSPWGLEWRFQF